MLQALYSNDGQQHLKIDVRNSLTTMETARMHFEWVKEEEELEGGRAARWNDFYKRFQLLSIGTKDACSYIENIGKRLNGEILKFIADKSKTISDCKAFVKRFNQVIENCDAYTKRLPEQYGQLSRDLTTFERTSGEKQPRYATKANSRPRGAEVAVRCVLDSVKHRGVEPLATALKSGFLPNFASLVLVQGAAAFFSPETFAELERQVGTCNNVAKRPPPEHSIISKDYEGLHERIVRIRSHLDAATATWSSIHGQCVQIKQVLELAISDQTDDPEVMKAHLETTRTIVLFLSLILMEYVVNIKFIDWRLWWLSKAEGDEIVTR